IQDIKNWSNLTLEIQKRPINELGYAERLNIKYSRSEAMSKYMGDIEFCKQTNVTMDTILSELTALHKSKKDWSTTNGHKVLTVDSSLVYKTFDMIQLEFI